MGWDGTAGGRSVAGTSSPGHYFTFISSPCSSVPLLSSLCSLSVHPSDPNCFASASCDKLVKIWDLRSTSCVRTFTGHESDINAVKFFPSGNSVGTGSDDSSCRVFDLGSCGPIHIFSREWGRGSHRHTRGREGDWLGRGLLLPHFHGPIRIAFRRSAFHAFSSPRALLLLPPYSPADQQISCGVTDVCFSLTGRLMFASYDEHFCIAWETISKEGKFHELRGHKGRVSCLGTNTTGQALAAGSWDTEISIWA